MTLETELKDLRKQVISMKRRQRMLCMLLAVIPFVALLGAGMQDRDGVLRARGLVLTDSQDRPRILIGAPVPSTEGRVRSDVVTGLLVLDEQGVDRMSVGAPVANPQVGGALMRRISPATGIQFNDQKGNERGGFGYLDNGRITLGMDRESGEGLMLFIMPPGDMGGISGVLLNGEKGPDRQRIFLGMSGDESNIGLSLSDPNGTRRSWFRLDDTGSPVLEAWNAEGERLLDLFDIRDR